MWNGLWHWAGQVPKDPILNCIPHPQVALGAVPNLPRASGPYPWHPPQEGSEVPWSTLRGQMG